MSGSRYHMTHPLIVELHELPIGTLVELKCGCVVRNVGPPQEVESFRILVPVATITPCGRQRVTSTVADQQPIKKAAAGCWVETHETYGEMTGAFTMLIEPDPVSDLLAETPWRYLGVQQSI